MSGGIYLIQNDDDLIEMRETSYDSEELLQQLIAKYPNLLAGDQVNRLSPRRWLLIGRETTVPFEENGSGRWSVDHLFIDQDAIPTIVEVKRSTDSRIRREVVGQMLEYAANAVLHWSVDFIRSRFERQCYENNSDPEQELAEFLGEDGDPESFWNQVQSNLQLGKIRLLFVADEIPPELRRIVEFLNKQMSNAEVLAIEIKQYQGEGLKTLVPRVFGHTAETERAKSGRSGSNNQWDEQSFFKCLQENASVKEIEVAQKILAWARTKIGEPWWGRGQYDGSFVPTFKLNGKPCSLFAVWTYGKIELYFSSYKNKKPFDQERKRLEFLRELNSILEDAIPEDKVSKYPKIDLSILAHDDRLDKFLQRYEWFIEEIRKSNLEA